jgi:phospholipid N-methyltransferase
LTKVYNVVVRDAAVFFRHFLKHPRQVSSIIPTSGAIARRLAKRIPVGKRQVIVEYGPGTGVLAKAILKSKRLSEDSKLILIEKSAVFARHLRASLKDRRIHVVHGAAEDIVKILADQKETHADIIFSSIPLSVFPPAMRNRLMRATKQSLSPEGTFVVFLYRHTVRGMLKQHFPRVRTRFEPFNLPPMFVFAATTKKPIAARTSSSRKK